MKIVCFSDTHKQRFNEIPDGDVLIFAGDDDIYNTYDLHSFLCWFSGFPHNKKIFIPGNHDLYLDSALSTALVKLDQSTIKKFFNGYGVTYLNNSGVTYKKIKFWGSPVTPLFMDWAFMLDRGSEINQVWKKIPNNCDVLITHGPPYKIMDYTPNGEHVGCYDLWLRIKKVQPKYHIFGHIHGGYGRSLVGDTEFVNCSVCNEQYTPTNKPMELLL